MRYEQMNIFSFIEPQKTFKPGEYVEEKFRGRKLTFDDIVNNVGNLIVLDGSTGVFGLYKAVLVEKIVVIGTQRMFVYYDGTRHRGYVKEEYFSKIKFPTVAYELLKNMIMR